MRRGSVGELRSLLFLTQILSRPNPSVVLHACASHAARIFVYDYVVFMRSRTSRFCGDYALVMGLSSVSHRARAGGAILYIEYSSRLLILESPITRHRVVEPL